MRMYGVLAVVLLGAGCTVDPAPGRVGGAAYPVGGADGGGSPGGGSAGEGAAGRGGNGGNGGSSGNAGEGGSSGSGGAGGEAPRQCTLSTGDAGCDACVQPRCRTECFFCEDEPECVAILVCALDNCFIEGKTIDIPCAMEACAKAHPAGSDIFTQVIACGNASCSSFCPM